MWLNLAAKLVPGMIKTGMSIASNRRKAKELESVAELKLAEKMEETQEMNMTNKVNIEFLRDQLEKALNDIEDLKDKVRANGNGAH